MRRNASPDEARGKVKKVWLAPNRKLELLAFFLVTALLLIVLWPNVTYTVEAGHAGAYYSRLFGGTDQKRSCREGIHFLLPWDSITSYDCRAQSRTFTITALSEGGLSIDVNASAIWYIDGARVGELHATMGPQYAESVIEPALASVVRSTIGSYQQAELYDGNPLKIQDDVLNLLKETLKDAPFSVHSILVREVKLPGDMASSIAQKFVAEQNVLTQRYKVLETFERYKSTYIESESTLMQQNMIVPGLSESYLRYLGIQATRDLAMSDNAKLVILGDKDGMPLLLNPETMTTSETMPTFEPYEFTTEARDQRVEDFLSTYERMNTKLSALDAILEVLMTSFPEVSSTIGKTDISQLSSIPIISPAPTPQAFPPATEAPAPEASPAP